MNDTTEEIQDAERFLELGCIEYIEYAGVDGSDVGPVVAQVRYERGEYVCRVSQWFDWGMPEYAVGLGAGWQREEVSEFSCPSLADVLATLVKDYGYTDLVGG